VESKAKLVVVERMGIAVGSGSSVAVVELCQAMWVYR
jgi:hypothetical protein